MKEGPKREMNVSWALWTVNTGLAGKEKGGTYVRRSLRAMYVMWEYVAAVILTVMTGENCVLSGQRVSTGEMV